jgi:hypothetical protein
MLQNLDRFLRWFCANISHQLGIEPKLDEYWNADIGSKVSCTFYLEEYLLKQLQKPVVNAHTQSGIYSDHLRHLLAAIHPYQDLQSALLTVIASEQPVELPTIVAYRLESIGLIKLDGNLATVSCGLYSKFFSQYLSA